MADKVVKSRSSSCALELPVTSIAGELLNVVALEGSNSCLVEDVYALVLSIA